MKGHMDHHDRLERHEAAERKAEAYARGGGISLVDTRKTVAKGPETKPLKGGGKAPGESGGHRLDRRARGGRMPKSKKDDDGDEDDEPEGRARGGRLTASERRALPAGDFALGKGHYPIEDAGHAKAALGRVSEFGTPAEKAAVRSKVHEKYPGMGKG